VERWVMFYRQINQYATAISTCFLEPMQHGSMSDTLVYTVKLPKNTPRRPAVSRRAERCCPPEVTWERTKRKTSLSATSTVKLQCGHSSIGAWGIGIGCKRFWIQASHMSNTAKVTSAWLPPRHRSITTPFIALKTWKLL
jgi:hypothetical protein